MENTLRKVVCKIGSLQENSVCGGSLQENIVVCVMGSLQEHTCSVCGGTFTGK